MHRFKDPELARLAAIAADLGAEMNETLIDNPNAAFQLPSETITTPPGVPSKSYVVFYNSGAAKINVNEWVALDVTGTAAHINGIIRGVHGGTIANCIGIALDTIPVGGYGRVCTAGPCLGIAGAAGVVAGNLLSPSTVSTDDGQLVAASSPTAGQVIGLCLQTQATHAGTFPMWVFKA